MDIISFVKGNSRPLFKSPYSKCKVTNGHDSFAGSITTVCLQDSHSRLKYRGLGLYRRAYYPIDDRL